MDLRGLVLIGFSAACLGVAGLAYQVDQKRSMSLSLAKTMAAQECGNAGFDTPFGRVSCLRQVSFPLVKGLLGAGGAMNRGR